MEMFLMDGRKYKKVPGLMQVANEPRKQMINLKIIKKYMSPKFKKIN